MSGIGLDATTPGGGAPTTGQLAVDQQRNQMLAALSKALSTLVAIWTGGGTITGDLSVTGNLSAGGNLAVTGNAVITGNESVTGTLTPNSVKGIVGTTTNDNAQAGSNGEYIESVVNSGSAIAITTNISKTVTSIALSAGDWDVRAYIAFFGNAATTVTTLEGSISLVNNTADSSPGRRADQYYGGATVFAITTVHFNSGFTRISIASPTTVYLIASAVFATNTCSAFGMIGARRIR